MEADGNQITTWLFEPDGFAPLAKLSEREQLSILTDHLGTPVEAYDAEGASRFSRSLGIYGQTVTAENEERVPFRYPGQYFDLEVGLCYSRFRYYDPSEGCYISRDPIGLVGGNPTLYGYVPDTNSWMDVFGLACSPDAAAREVLPKANALSIKHNREFGGLIYEQNGKFFATPPMPGGPKSFKPAVAKKHVPDTGKIVGDYHTHGDYSKIITSRTGKDKIVRTNKIGDIFNSDVWSRPDKIFHSGMPSGHSSYLGTPSGVYRKLLNGVDSVFKI